MAADLNAVQLTNGIQKLNAKRQRQLQAISSTDVEIAVFTKQLEELQKKSK